MVEARGSVGVRERGGRPPSALSRRPLVPFFSLLVFLSLAACDVAEPEPEQIVVEAFVETGEVLPAVTVRRTAALDDPDAAPPVSDAEVVLTIGGETVPYRAVPGMVGTYEPEAPQAVEVGDAFTLAVGWERQRALASSRLPAPIVLDSVRVTPSPSPVEAVFADSLGLAIGEGVIYPVTVSLFWTAPEADTAWVRARLRPPASFPSAIVDFVLDTDATRREAEFAGEDPRVRRWSGTYAVPVETLDDALPAHALDVFVLRSGTDYARYALSRNDPAQREPVGNVEGGLGIVAGVAIDTWEVAVE
jgi:hypothetical protein